MHPMKSAGSSKELRMITFFNRKGRLYVQFEVDGKRYQRSLKMEDTVANRKLATSKIIPKLQLKILSGEFGKEKKDAKKFEHYARLYLKSKDSVKTYSELSSMVENQLVSMFGKRTITSISRGDVKSWIDEKLDDVSVPRVSRLLQVLGAIFDIAVDYEHIETNPARGHKLPRHAKKTEEPFTPQQVKHLLKNAESKWFRNFLAFAFYTGARTGELIALTWNDVNIDDMYIDINKSKRHGVISSTKTLSGMRKVPIFASLLPYIKSQRRNASSIFVFTNPQNDEQFWSSKNLKPYWERTCKNAGVQKTRLYNTRHTFITNMLKEGSLSILEIAQIVGHKNTEMIIKNYANFIRGEQLKISRDLDPFTDNSADRYA